MEESSSEDLGRKQSKATRDKISRAMEGSKNPAYDQGQRSYREKTGAKPGQLVHHKNGDRGDNRRSNLEIIPKNKRAEHDKTHHREDNFNKSGGTKKVSTKHKSRI